MGKERVRCLVAQRSNDSTTTPDPAADDASDDEDIQFSRAEDVSLYFRDP